MGKKKKSQLNPVARGFATTSQPSKRVIAEAQEAAAIAESEAAAASNPAPTPDQPASVTQTGDPNVVTDSKELDFEEQTWQDMVDRWQNKTDREIARTIQILETERRLAKSLPRITLDPLWRRHTLDLLTRAEEGKPKVSSDSSNKTLPRLATIYGVLRRVGFQHATSIHCLQSVQNLDLDDALDWVYLHCDTDELPDSSSNPQSNSTFKASSSIRCGTTFTSRPTPPIPNPSTSKLSQPPASSSATPFSKNTSRKAPSNAATPPTPVCASGEESPSTFDSDEDLDPSILHAHLHLRILTLRQSGRSDADPKVATLMRKQKGVAEDYMFNAKDAHREFLSLKAAMDEAHLKARLRGESSITGSTTDGKKRAGKSGSKPPPSPAALEPPAAEEDEDEGETMFSTMLDEMPTTEVSNTGTTVSVRNLPVPKQASFAKSPKTLLSETARKIDKYAVVSYEIISGTSKAIRVKCDVRWNGGRTSEWRMDEVGCWDRGQAEWFVSTVALHALAYPLPDEDDMGFVTGGGAQSGAAGISISGVTNFPVPYREVWSELEEERKRKEAARNRKIWKCLLEVVDARSVTGENNATPSAKKTATPPNVTGPNPNAIISPYSQTLQAEFAARKASLAHQTMLQQRQTLPIAAYRDRIIQTLSFHQVLVLSGETGCGKSTQLPAFILEDQLSRGIPCKIFCTEPRRISAISLAQRVSAEQGEPPGAVGTSNSLVGYSVRLDSHIGPKTSLAYVTYGIALRILENGSVGGQAGTAFDEITHIIIDEVHERSIESDFLLIVLRSLIERRKDLKVVLMSATVDSEKISRFFGGCPTLQVPGRTFPVDVRYLEDAVEFTGWKVDNLSSYAKQLNNKMYKSGKLDWNEDLEVNSDDEDIPTEGQVVKFEKRYSQQTTSTINLFDERLIPYDLIIRLLERICFEDDAYATYSAAVLVFMPGLNEIRKLTDMLVSHGQFGGDAFRVYPLHSTISSEDQGAVFNIPPAGVRKIVIATNIAETGITIPDITCVIDTGKHREMRFDEKRQLSRLVETYIARSNAAQRRGRAGRVQEGLCFHLFTKSRHDTQLIDHPLPEMLRLSLSDLALRIKMMNIFNGLSVEEVLSKALDPPIVLNVQRAVASLVEAKALTPTEEITPMGRLLSKLPTDVHLGKFLLFASIFKCLDPALTIAAALTSKSPFITPFGHEAGAALAKASFRSDDSDFLTIHNAFASWRRAHANGQGVARTLCKKSFLSYLNLQHIEEIRQQYLSYLVDASFVRVDAVCQKELSHARFTSRQRIRFVSLPPDLNTNAQNNESWAINAALAAGLFPKLLIIEKGKMHTLGNSLPVAFHPSSVNFKKRPEDIVGGGMCLMYFTLMHSKKLYVWETSPVNDYALLLLCGDVEFKPAVGQIIVDRKLKFQVDAKTALAFKALRMHLSSALHVRLRGKVPSMMLEEWVRLAFDVLSCKATE